MKKIITELKDLPADLQKLVDAGKVTYRGNNLKEGIRIKVNGKEYNISDDLYDELGGIKKMRFAAPFRKEK